MTCASYGLDDDVDSDAIDDDNFAAAANTDYNSSSRSSSSSSSNDYDNDDYDYDDDDDDDDGNYIQRYAVYSPRTRKNGTKREQRKPIAYHRHYDGTTTWYEGTSELSFCTQLLLLFFYLFFLF